MSSFSGKGNGVGILVVGFVDPVKFGMMEGAVDPVEEEVFREEEK